MAAKQAATAAAAAAKPYIEYSRALGLKAIKGVTAFQVRYTDLHAYSITSGRFAPGYPTLQQIYADRKYMVRTDPFWWSCVARKDTGFAKSVVRSWSARRVRNALGESLAKKGFAKDGARLEKGAGKHDLYGSAQLTPTALCLRMPYTELVKQTDIAVEWFMGAREERLHKEETQRKKQPVAHRLGNTAAATKPALHWQERGKTTKNWKPRKKLVLPSVYSVNSLAQLEYNKQTRGARLVQASGIPSTSQLSLSHPTTYSKYRRQNPGLSTNTTTITTITMLISLTVGKVDAGVAVLLTHDKRLIEFPSILLPPNISSGSIVDITVSRNLASEQKSQQGFLALQDAIFSTFGASEPQAPILRCRNATQTSVVLEWDPIELATADCISLSLFRNGQKAGNIPRPTTMQVTKISGLAVDTEYTFQLVLRTTAGTFNSEKLAVKTHKMTDLSGITVTPGILPAQLRDSLSTAVERIGAKLADTVRIDTTHFVTTEGRGIAWEKAVEMNIPVVRPEWVEGCERGGRIVGVRQYYLDADPRQRQIPDLQQQPPTPKEAPQSPTTNGKTNGANGTPVEPPTPPAKDTPKEAEEESSEDDEEDEDDRSTVPDEQKVRVEDREQHKVALRPGKLSPTAEEKEKGKEEGEAADDNSGSGSQTPGDSNFQEVAL
ncbi:uncharacterized protein BP5553_05878 [Venustampulla echinocandica]|uniref:BRCT protein n=1 Tax=Venustampulla echinocandica TaxID=2656787 RepID=A0A370TLX7_9HELO|nr:uncharacterized protein BP5553_05878 [Venustampulla echinocandica]RDL36526.1 hypothetical protein BP5553_05878 [Venustampulla echinocandica]